MHPNAALPPPILLIDDDESDLERLKFILAQSGVPNSVMRFSNAHDAMQYLTAAHRGFSSLRPCLVISDVAMPSIDGFEFLRWVRRQPQLEDVRVALITSNRSEQLEKTAQQLGADALLPKFPPPEVLQALLQPKDMSPPMT